MVGFRTQPPPGAGCPDPGRNVLVLAASTATFVVAIFTWYRLLPLILRDLGATDLAVSVSYSLFTLGSGLLQWPGGILSDRFGRKPLIVLPTLGGALLYALAGTTWHWPVLVGALVAINSLSALQSPSFVALMAESVTADRRGTAFAVFQLFIGGAVALGPALGVILLPRLGTRVLILATAGAGLAVAAWRQFYLVETFPVRESRRSFPVREAFRGPLLLVLLIGTAFLTLSAITAYGPFISLYARDVQGLGPEQINILFAVGPLVAVTVSLAGGRFIRMWGARRVMAAAIAGHVLTLLFWLRLDAFIPAAAVFALAIFFFQVGAIAYDTLRSGVADEGNRGAALGVIGTVSGLLSAIGPPLAGTLKSRYGPASPFWLAAAIGIALVILLRGLPEGERRDESLPEAIFR